jgi:NADPH-dependent glutamate synthase beta subunit-like oxidoreductase/Pyruvate/2-oxoacid:ferredoxin oxidoreductase delta subunit
MATPADKITKTEGITFRRFKDGDYKPRSWRGEIFDADHSHKCPTYQHSTPPCQASCPAGEEIRGYMNIIRGIEKPATGQSWQEYAFRRLALANPFPSVMGRVCPAPCEAGCNRNEVDDKVGINAVEQFIGDTALKNKYAFQAPATQTGKKVAIIGGGPAGLSCAYHLALKGHAVTIFDDHKELGGMMRYGIPGFRMPRDVLDGEIKRILDLGVQTRLGVRVGKDIALDKIKSDYDAVFVGLGAQSGRPLPVPGAEASNCITGVAFLDAFNQGRLQHVGKRVVVIGGGDTSIDVATVARRLGNVKTINPSDRPELAVQGAIAHDVATTAAREGAHVILVSRASLEKMNASKQEIEEALAEGVEIRGNLTPVAVVLGSDGRAKALRVAELEIVKGKQEIKPGTEKDIEADLIVAAIGQTGDFSGLASLDNGKGLVNADKNYQVPGMKGFFVGGDVIRPHLLTTAIGHGAIAADGIDHYLQGHDLEKRPRIDVHHFDLHRKMVEKGLKFAPAPAENIYESHKKNIGIHNYEDRAHRYVIKANELFLGHFLKVARNQRKYKQVSAEDVLGNFQERLEAYDDKQVVDEAKRCMSCGVCFECDNCVVYCPQVAVKRVPKAEATLGNYVFTDYSRCIGCHICADVCPTGYIQMAMGE